MLIKDFSVVTSQLDTKLVDYLQFHNIDTTKKFKCISPDHDDKTPSMSIIPNSDGSPSGIFHCFGCGISGSIFHAAHFLENKPISGIGFLTDNLVYLATKYNIKIDVSNMTELDVYELDARRALRDATNLITNIHFGDYKLFDQEIEKRKWNKEELIKDAGTVNSQEYITTMINLGYTNEFLKEIGLLDTRIFNNTSFIFVIRDEWGHPVGFAARNLEYDKQVKKDSSVSKYINSSMRNARIDIFNKNTRLFNMHNCRNQATVYIFEGHPDVITASQHGIKNCVALCGTSLSNDHIILLRKFGITKIIICLDGDEPGQKATKKIISSALNGTTGLRVNVIIIPNNQDPDEFITSEGINTFNSLKRLTAFSWALTQYTDQDNNVDICNEMVPIIAAEPSNINRETYIKELADFTNISIGAITNDVDDLINDREKSIINDNLALLEAAYKTSKRNPHNILAYLEEARDNVMENLERQSSHVKVTFLDRVLGIKEMEENKDGNKLGFKFNRLQKFGQCLSNDWNRDKLMLLGAKPNCGKTCFLSTLAYELAEIEENNCIVLYFSLDDALELILSRFICIALGNPFFMSEYITNPNYFNNYKSGENIAKCREHGYNKFMNLVRNDKIEILDRNSPFSQDPTNLAFIEYKLKQYRQNFPNRNIIFIIDSFYDLADSTRKKDTGMRTDELLSSLGANIKKLTSRYDASAFLSMHYKKLGPGIKPTDDCIRETGEILYHADFIMHFFNELHEFKEKSQVYRDINTTLKTRNNRIPIVEMIWGKNKISNYKHESTWLDFFDGSSTMFNVDKDTIGLNYQIDPTLKSQYTWEEMKNLLVPSNG